MAFVRTGKPGVARIPKVDKPELRIQQSVAKYLRYRYPDVIFHSDFSSGFPMSQYQASVNKSIQSQYKFPDMIILATGREIVHNGRPTGKHYKALAIELKADGETVVLKIGPDKGKLTKDPHVRAQAATLRKLNAQGWYANFAVGYDAAIKIIDWYFDRPINRELF